MKLHRYVDHQRLHIVTKDVISLSISVLLLFRHYISHKITFGAPSSGGVLCSASRAFISQIDVGYRCSYLQNACQNSNQGRPLVKLLLQKQSDQGLHCLSRPFWQATIVRKFRTFTVCYIFQSSSDAGSLLSSIQSVVEKQCGS